MTGIIIGTAAVLTVIVWAIAILACKVIDLNERVGKLEAVNEPE